MGFGEKWKNWILACLGSASISILVNGSPTKEFKLEKGVRQGEPLSPFLFIHAAKGLNWLTKASINKGLFIGVEVGSDEVPVSILQYADDTIFFEKWDSNNIRSLLTLLKCFELTSGLKVNYNKSNLFGIGVDVHEIEDMARMFGCKVGTLPFTYLGLSIGANMNKMGS
ncbi:uncharacterized mitochondrial protein AtMg01250-like [Rutidosis leptorrhynchoides]|uniref:uncharacterized mitochondrial protein AtMg01250-like n=1 Tax=Rutidosis leptorrhynchoides TaxID=125765 RepID=UPI003A9A32A4